MATHKPLVIISGTVQQLPAGDGLQDIASIENGLVINEAGADVDFRVEGDTATQLFVCDAGTNSVHMGTTTLGAIASFTDTSTSIGGTSLNYQFIVQGAGGLSQLFRVENATSTINFGSGGGNWVRFTDTLAVFNDQGSDRDFRIEGDTLTHAVFLDASAATENIALLTTAAPDWQSMDGGVFLGDAATAPTGNPTAGVFIYSESGELKVRDGGGNVTPLSNAYYVGGTDVAVADGGTGASDAATARANLGLTIGTHVQAFDSDLTSLASGITGIVKGAGDGNGYSAATAGTDYYAPGGTDVAVADGGTGASTASGARTNLGLVIGADVQAFDTELNQIAGLADPGADRILFWDESANSYAHLTVGSNLSISDTTLNATGGGGGGLTITGTKSANYTAANGDHVVCDTNAAAGDFTITLPATPSSGDMVRVTLITDHATRVVDVAGNGENINGSTTVSHLRLCLEGDTLLFTYLGGGVGWMVEDGIRPHSAEMVRAASQSIAFNTRVGNEINFDTTSYDTGGLADLTNNRFLIRRSGKYMLTAYWGRSSTMDDGQRLITWIRKFTGVSGSDSDLRWVGFLVSPAATQSIIATVATAVDLAAGDKLDMVVEQTDSNPTANTETILSFRPTFVLAEIR